MNDGELLPPGWVRAWSSTSGQNYFADTLTQASQWDPPDPCVDGVWRRNIDESSGRAFWTSEIFKMSFYERDSKWQRYETDGLAYWFNVISGHRFYENLTDAKSRRHGLRSIPE